MVIVSFTGSAYGHVLEPYHDRITPPAAPKTEAECEGEVQRRIDAKLAEVRLEIEAEEATKGNAPNSGEDHAEK
jgi:hypothetical protein